MAKKTKKLTQKMQAWIEARKRESATICLTPKSTWPANWDEPGELGKIDNHKQEPWKLPLPQFIEELYSKRFGKTSPKAVLSIEERGRREAEGRGTSHSPAACRGQRDTA